MPSPEPLAVKLCGGLRVSRGGAELDLSKTARQGRLTLTYLLLNRDRPVARGELMGRIWEDPDPERVAASLSQTLSRLRQVLGRESVQRLPGGAVRLRGPLSVDVEDAATSLRDARRSLADREWAAVLDQARSALAQTAGQVLAGDDADWLEGVRREVDELRAEALELQAAAALRTRAPGDAEAAARRATEIDETRESAWALLMKAQAAHGNLAAATETFHRFRTRLGEVYGLTPSRELIELHGRLLDGGTDDERGPVAGPAGPVAFPPALALAHEDGDEAFVGREEVLARLREHYALAEDGSRQVVLLHGEPGIGKTRLAAEFAREIHGRGAIVLYGRSDAEALVPYQPFVTALERYIADCGGGDFASELDVELAELSRLIPSLRRHLPELREPVAVEPEMRRYRVFNAVAETLAYVARRRPMVLVLDDLHWGDTSRALLLKHMLEQIRDMKLLILGTMRDDEPCRSEQLADFFARPQRGFEQFNLTGLDVAETAAFVMARRGRGASEDALDILRRASGGNPLLLEETLKSVAESEAPGDGLSEGMVRRLEVPKGAKHVIDRRLERLAPSTQQALADASVVGLEFDVRVLEAITEPATVQVIRALEEAEAAGLVREAPDAVDRFAFSHALVRDVLLGKQSAAWLRRLRFRIGEALEVIARSSEVHPAELAHHFFLASGDNRAAARKAIDYSIEAGDRAAQSRAYEDAAGHYERARELLDAEREPDEARRCDLLLRIGRMQLRQGSAEARRTFERASEVARRHGLLQQLAKAALGFAPRYAEAGVVDEEAIALLRSALDALPDEPSALRAELMARLSQTLHFAAEQQAVVALSEQALAMAREAGDARVLVSALESRHEALLHVEHLDERLLLSQELLD